MEKIKGVSLQIRQKLNQFYFSRQLSAKSEKDKEKKEKVFEPMTGPLVELRQASEVLIKQVLTMKE